MGGPDFRNESVLPHRLASGIIEMPMTILYTGLLKKEGVFGKFYAQLPKGIFKRTINLLFRQKWLRIFPTTTYRDFKNILNAARVNNLPALVFMVHSTELHFGTSSYTKNEADVEFMYKKLEELFSLMKKEGLTGITLSDFAKSWMIY